eukprot:UN02601
MGPVPSYEMLGSHINMITNQMMMLNDGFDLSITNIIADNGNMAMGVQGDSYFSIRHSLAFEGPLGVLLSGGQRDYSAEFIAQRGKDYTLVANWTPAQGTPRRSMGTTMGKNISSTFNLQLRAPTP